MFDRSVVWYDIKEQPADRRFMRKEHGMTVTPRKASTLLLLRDGALYGGASTEALLLLRHPGNSFVPEHYVYPGGAVEIQDVGVVEMGLCRGIDPDCALALIEDAETAVEAMAYWVAAARETFEETGILIAVRTDGSPPDFRNGTFVERIEMSRRRLCEEEIVFADFLQNEGLLVACDRMKYFSRWITPEFLPIRYDAHFFVAAFPDDQIVKHDGKELVEHLWIDPREAIKACGKGSMRMVLPTIETLRAAGSFSSVQDAMRGLSLQGEKASFNIG